MHPLFLAAAVLTSASRVAIGFGDARQRAATDASPAVAQSIAEAERSAAEVGLARGVDDPVMSLGTNRLTAKETAGVSVALPTAAQTKEIRAARDDLRAAQRLVDRARLDARAAAGRAWVALRLAETKAALASAAADASRRLRDAAKERFDRGEIPRRDLVQAEADLARAEADETAAAMARVGADAQLRSLLGEDAPLATSGDAPDPLAGAAPSEVELLASIAHSPDADAEAATIAGTDARVTAAKLGWVPALTANAGISANDPTTPGTDASAGVDVTIPIGGRHGADVREARALRARARAEADAAARRRAADARAALGDVGAARARFEALARRAVPAQEESSRMTEEAWRAGEVGFVEVVLARRAAADVEREKEEAWADAIDAEIELARLSGRSVGAIDP